jgi:hypothetical protein
MNAMLDAPDLPQLLDIDVQQIAGRWPFVAIRRLWRLEMPQLREAGRRCSRTTVAIGSPRSRAMRSELQRRRRRRSTWVGSTA